MPLRKFSNVGVIPGVVIVFLCSLRAQMYRVASCNKYKYQLLANCYIFK